MCCEAPLRLCVHNSFSYFPETVRSRKKNPSPFLQTMEPNLSRQSNVLLTQTSTSVICDKKTLE